MAGEEKQHANESIEPLGKVVDEPTEGEFKTNSAKTQDENPENEKKKRDSDPIEKSDTDQSQSLDNSESELQSVGDDQVEAVNAEANSTNRAGKRSNLSKLAL